MKPDDLIMRGIEGEEYPIGRDLFNKTYDLVDESQTQRDWEAVYQIENDPDDWVDVDQVIYEGHDGSRKRILYTAPPSAPVRVPDSVIVLLNHLETLMDEGTLKEDAIPTDMWNAVSMHNFALAQQPAPPSAPVGVEGLVERMRQAPSRLWMADLVGQKISVERMRDILAFALEGGAS